MLILFYGYCCFAVWGSSALSARSAGDIGVWFVWIDRVLLRVILPQITQIPQRGMQQAALFRRERQLVANFVLWLLLFCRLGFGVLSASSARSAGDIGVFFVLID